MRLQQICQGHLQPDEATYSRWRATGSSTGTQMSYGKTIIWASYTYDIQQIAWPCATALGPSGGNLSETPQDERQETVNRFQGIVRFAFLSVSRGQVACKSR